MRVLIANRGEIAVRIVRACRELGMTPLVAYSSADKGSLAVRLADEAFCIGPGPAGASYLNIGAVLTAARALNADAIHPGYGFLSESAAFAQACADEGLEFIGPDAATINLMGNKVNARGHAEALGVPVVPGRYFTGGSDDATIFDRVGLPAIIKAAAGGGGRGMRLVREKSEGVEALSLARNEALSAFGNDQVYVERFVEHARHIEIQILGLGSAGTVAVGERDCSVQRRHQKLIEETPCGVITDEIRAGLIESAIRLASGTNYVGAGTVEFLYDLDRGEFYFLEMNTRLQVEHGVTEEAYGVDLVRQQLLLAAHKDSDLRVGDEFTARGHALECRLLAEDSRSVPSPGTVTGFFPPSGPGVRFDSYLEVGAVVPPFYDSMIAKIVVTAPDRNQAIARMRRALGELTIDGIATNADTLLRIISAPDFVADTHDTAWYDQTFSTTQQG